MAWLYILGAGIIETLWPFALKRYQDNAWAPMIVGVIASVPIFYLLSAAMKTLPTGTVYLAFIALGSIGVTSVGILFYHESTNALRLLCLALTIAGVVGLKYFAGTSS